MKERVTAVISFLSAIGWGIAIVIVMLVENINLKDEKEFLLFFSVLTASISTILYIIWTKFGKREKSDLEKLDYENQILKKQIEKQELIKKLEK